MFVATPLGLKALVIAVVGAGALAVFRQVDENIKGGKVFAEFENALRQELTESGIKAKRLDYKIKDGRFAQSGVLVDKDGKEIMVNVFDKGDGEPSVYGPAKPGQNRNARTTLSLEVPAHREFIARTQGKAALEGYMTAYNKFKSELNRKIDLQQERDKELDKIKQQIKNIETRETKTLIQGDEVVGRVKRTDLSDAEKAEVERLKVLGDRTYENYNQMLMKDATTPALTTPEENIFLQGYENFKRQSEGFYDESMRTIDKINEILQAPEKKSPEVSFLPLGAASQSPSSAASATQTNVAVFSATDSNTPYGMAVRSIYNMVNA